MTKREELYNLLVENPQLTNPEIMEELGWDSAMVRKYKNRLKTSRHIDYELGQPLKILRPFREEIEHPSTLKQEVLGELLEAYRSRLEHVKTTEELVLLGTEIRKLLKEIA